MEMKRISDEEIRSHFYRISTCPNPEDCFTKNDGTILGGNRVVFADAVKLAGSQLSADQKVYQENVKALFEELENPCSHDPATPKSRRYKNRQCALCMSEIKKKYLGGK